MRIAKVLDAASSISADSTALENLPIPGGWFCVTANYPCTSRPSGHAARTCREPTLHHGIHGTLRRGCHFNAGRLWLHTEPKPKMQGSALMRGPVGGGNEAAVGGWAGQALRRRTRGG